MQTQDVHSMPPYVTFEKKAVENREAEIEKGRYGFKDVYMAFVTRPGSRDTVEIEVESWLKQLADRATTGLVPANWLPHFQQQFEAFKKGEEAPLNGTPILGWALLSPAEQKTVIAGGIKTIEDLAAANDEALMRVGMGSRVWKTKAETWLKEVVSAGATAAQMGTLTRDNEALKAQNAEMLAKMADMQKQLAALTKK